MKMNKLLVLGLILFSLGSCKKDDVAPSDPEHEEELITTVRLAFVNKANASDSTVYNWQDEDHIEDAVQDTISVLNGVDYKMYVWVLNEENPSDVENITEEVEEEAKEHQFFFSGTAVSMGHLDISYNDQDGDGNPIGILNDVSVSGAMQDMQLKVTLRHEPNKEGTDVSDGDITNAGGETDVEVTFIVDIVNPVI